MMLPITRATIENSCRVCLQDLGRSKNTRSHHYDPHLLRILDTMASGIQSTKISMPTYLCHNCFTTVGTFCKFAEMSICSSVALNEIKAEQQELTEDVKFQMLCGTCCKTNSEHNETVTENVTELQSLLQVIFTGIAQGEPHDGKLARNMCKQCLTKFRVFLDLQRTLRESQKYILTHILSNSEDKTDLDFSMEKTESPNTFLEEESEENVNQIAQNSESEMECFVNMDASFDKDDASFDKDDPFELKVMTYTEKNNSTLSTVVIEGVADLVFCPTCNKEYKSHAQLRVHNKRVHITAENTCSYCQRKFKRKHHLNDHVRIVHEGVRPYKCEFCERSFGLARTLRIHQMGHTNERPFMCTICEKTFRQKTDLRLHINDHSADFRCPICSRCKGTQEELDTHFARHNNKDGYQCSTCGRKFKKLCHLKCHTDAVHLKLRPFNCSQEGCDKAFATRRTLQLHQRTHTGESPHTCDICGRGFSSKSNVLRHAQSHSETVEKFEELLL